MSIQWQLPQDLLAESIEVMAPHGRRGNEGLSLWLGTELGTLTCVTHMVELRGPGFMAAPQQLRISLSGMSALTDLADQLNVYLVGQIHSHPGYFVDLSHVDKAYGIRIPGYLSLVCPHYAQFATTRLDHCGAHVFERGEYRRMPACEAARRIVTSPMNVSKLELEVPK